MHKQDLIDFVAEKAAISKKEATKAIDAVFDGITEGLKSDKEARFVGFGTFLVKTRDASKGRNPKTGEEIDIAASNRVSFRPGKELKSIINS